MATTPPPVTLTEPPPTPLYGARYDATAVDTRHKQPKKSTARTRNPARTPSPTGNFGSSDSTSPGLRRSARLRSYGQSPPSSPHSPSRAQRRPAGDRQAKPGHKEWEGKSGAKRADKALLEPHASSSLLSASSMLPTPTKTPRKKDAATKKSPSVTRILFPNGPQPIEEEAMPKSHRKGARSNALSLESFEHNGTYGGASSGADIEIFTDTRDKVPEVDASADNPFYSPGSRKSKRKVDSHRAADPGLQKALEDDQGMVYVFRGQRRYKPFRNVDEDTPEEGPNATEGLDLEQLGEGRRFTRSSVKPRVLFPKAAAPCSTTDDEEADTDIDETAAQAAAPAKASTPTKAAPSLGAGPITPPTTTRAKKRTVAYDLEGKGADPFGAGPADDSLFTVKKARRAGPDDGAGSTLFADWKRTKAAAGADRLGSLKGKKRAGDSLDNADEAKRSRAEA